jgi:hypothetical protein
VKFKTKSQLPYVEKGGILDDCGPSSVSALVAWSSAYEVDPSAGDGIAMKAKITGQKDVNGVSDNGSSLAQLIKVANGFGAKARWAKSWEDVVASAKRGAGIGVWVQQPIGYPAGLEISAWMIKWARWWKKTDPAHLAQGFGHMTAAGWCPDHGWWWTCPTRSGKGAEEFGVLISEENLRKIADSKRVAKKDKLPDYRHTIIVEWPKKVSAPAPVVEPTAKVEVAPVVPPVAKVSPAPVAAPKPKAQGHGYDKELAALGRVDWNKKANEAGKVLGSALAATEKEKGTMDKIKAAITYIIANTGIDEAILEALRVGISTGIAVMLATGAPILDMTTEDFRVVGSGAIAATLQVLVRALNKDDQSFGVGKLKATREAAEKAARIGTRAK